MQTSFTARHSSAIATVIALAASAPAFAVSTTGPHGVSGPAGVDPVSGGIGYRYYVNNLSQFESVSGLTRHVAFRSFMDTTAPEWHPGDPQPNQIAPANRGWTHNSDFVAINLDQPGFLTITVSAQGGVAGANAAANLAPAFVLWSGIDNDAAPTFPTGSGAPLPSGAWPQPTAAGDYHGFHNGANTAWMEDLNFLAAVKNDAAADFGTNPVVSRTFDLPAGAYTIVIGGNRNPAEANSAFTGRQGYSLSVSLVPEPVTLSLLAGVGVIALRRTCRA